MAPKMCPKPPENQQGSQVRRVFWSPWRPLGAQMRPGGRPGPKREALGTPSAPPGLPRMTLQAPPGLRKQPLRRDKRRQQQHKQQPTSTRTIRTTANTTRGTAATPAAYNNSNTNNNNNKNDNAKNHTRRARSLSSSRSAHWITGVSGMPMSLSNLRPMKTRKQ